MPRAFVSVGSNIDRKRHIRAAVQALAAHYGLLRLSRVYESRAVGFAGENFYNLVAAFETGDEPAAVAAVLKRIEDAEGRVRTGPRFSSRTMDLDLILWGQRISGPGEPPLPRPEILEHAHVLAPLAEVAPEARHPVLGRTYADLWQSFEDPGQALWPVAMDLPGEPAGSGAGPTGE